VIPLIVTWARKAGVPATQFTSRKLYACIHTSCSTSLTRDGFSVALTARVGADNTYVAQPGDVLYVVEVTIRPM